MAQRLSLVRASVLSLFAVSLAPSAAAIELDTNSVASISAAAKTIADSFMTTYYDASSTAGDFTQPEPWCKYIPT